MANRQYKEKLDGFYSTVISTQMWHGLQHITDHTTTSTISFTNSLPDDLKTFNTRFEACYNTERKHTHTTQTPTFPITVSLTQIHKALRKIYHPMATGLDNIPGQAFRACANELADVLLSNISLSQKTVSSCFKTTAIIPIPKKKHLLQSTQSVLTE